jgi:ribonuclease Z
MSKTKKERGERSFSRRDLLKGVGLGAGAVMVGGIFAGTNAAVAGPLGRIKGGKGSEGKKLSAGAGLSVTLLGTGTPIPNRERACASTLVIAGDRCFLVDTGRGFLNNFADTGLKDVDAVFLTHFHSDHFGEFAEFMVTRTIWGAGEPLTVTGPAGAKQVIGSLLDAYQLDNSYRKAHHGNKWNEAGMKAEIKESQSGVVYDKDGVKVTMFEVDHTPVKPAVGYRFDYKGQAVVVSGDTKKTAAMIEMAKGADILVHEVASRPMTELGRKGLDDRMQAMAEEMLQYHTLTDEVAQIAQDAGVKKLVLTHFAPSIPANPAMESIFVQGMGKIYKGDLIIGRDGMEIKA